MFVKQVLTRLNRRDYPILPKVKIILSVFIFSLLAFSVATSIKSIAQDAPVPADSKMSDLQFGVEAKKEQAMEGWNDKNLDATAINSFVKVAGTPKFDKDGNVIGFAQDGITGVGTQMVAATFMPPASGIQYIAQVKDEFLGKPAYAQGVGFKGLQPVLPLWRAFRNVIYVLSSVVFIFVGIMIMLRIKISPQAVINIQNAIPQIITTLLLVTFSYAIAGLFIDLSYFFQSASLAILFSAVGKGLNENIITGILPDTYTFATLSQAHLGEIFNLTLSASPTGHILVLGGIITLILTAILAVNPATLAAAPAALAIGGIATVVIALIVVILILFWVAKFYFGLIKCYITVLFKIIMAPLEIGMGAIPGSKMGFSTWANELVANLAVFPISVLFLVLANLIIFYVDNGHLWMPNLVDGSILAGNLLGGGNVLIKVGVGLSTIALMSKLPELIPQYIFMLKPSPWGVAIGEGIKDAQGFPNRMADFTHRWSGFRDDVRRIRPPPPESPAPVAPVAQAPSSGYMAPRAPMGGARKMAPRIPGPNIPPAPGENEI